MTRRWTLNTDPAALLILTNGYQSWSESELRPLLDTSTRAKLHWMVEQGHDPVFPPSDEAGVWRSHTLVALVDKAGGGWVGCAMNAEQTFAHWEVRATDQQVEVSCALEGPDIDVIWEETTDVIGTVERLTGQLGQAMGAKRPPPLRVWCSWYSYFRDVTLQDMLDNARLSKEQALPFDVFQLDDGFQAELGDWFEANPAFGGHAKDLPAQLNTMGYRAGLWLAPFLVSPNSKLYAAHPDWLLKDESGAPLFLGNNWGGPYAALDTTHPEALTWLRELAATCREWGYDYLKIDFLYAASFPGVRHDPTVSRAQAYRMGLQAIRDGLGEDGFLLGCGAPLASAIGLVDAMRTGPDVTLFWDDEARRVLLQDGAVPATRSALQTTLARWYQQTWYQPDPDVMIARRERSLLNDRERTAMLGMIDTIGGLRASSDPIAMLDADGLALLRRTLEITTPDRPAALTAEGGPTVTRWTRGRFNITDSPVDGLPGHGFASISPH